ncbi:hypothetical protein ACO2Q8_07910 [Larkinella sp. VNQ87]
MYTLLGFIIGLAGVWVGYYQGYKDGVEQRNWLIGRKPEKPFKLPLNYED